MKWNTWNSFSLISGISKDKTNENKKKIKGLFYMSWFHSFPFAYIHLHFVYFTVFYSHSFWVVLSKIHKPSMAKWLKIVVSLLCTSGFLSQYRFYVRHSNHFDSMVLKKRTSKKTLRKKKRLTKMLMNDLANILIIYIRYLLIILHFICA